MTVPGRIEIAYGFRFDGQQWTGPDHPQKRRLVRLPIKLWLVVLLVLHRLDMHRAWMWSLIRAHDDNHWQPFPETWASRAMVRRKGAQP